MKGRLTTGDQARPPAVYEATETEFRTQVTTLLGRVAVPQTANIRLTFMLWDPVCIEGIRGLSVLEAARERTLAPDPTFSISLKRYLPDKNCEASQVPAVVFGTDSLDVLSFFNRETLCNLYGSFYDRTPQEQHKTFKVYRQLLIHLATRKSPDFVLLEDSG